MFASEDDATSSAIVEILVLKRLESRLTSEKVSFFFSFPTVGFGVAVVVTVVSEAFFLSPLILSPELPEISSSCRLIFASCLHSSNYTCYLIKQDSVCGNTTHLLQQF